MVWGALIQASILWLNKERLLWCTNNKIKGTALTVVSFQAHSCFPPEPLFLVQHVHSWSSGDDVHYRNQGLCFACSLSSGTARASQGLACIYETTEKISTTNTLEQTRQWVQRAQQFRVTTGWCFFRHPSIAEWEKVPARKKRLSLLPPHSPTLAMGPPLPEHHNRDISSTTLLTSGSKASAVQAWAFQACFAFGFTSFPFLACHSKSVAANLISTLGFASSSSVEAWSLQSLEIHWCVCVWLYVCLGSCDWCKQQVCSK